MRRPLEENMFVQAAAEARYKSIVIGDCDPYMLLFNLCLEIEVAERKLAAAEEDNEALRKLLEARSGCPDCYDTGKVIEDGTTVWCECGEGEAAARECEAEGLADRAERSLEDWHEV